MLLLLYTLGDFNGLQSRCMQRMLCDDYAHRQLQLVAHEHCGTEDAWPSLALLQQGADQHVSKRVCHRFIFGLLVQALGGRLPSFAAASGLHAAQHLLPSGAESAELELQDQSRQSGFLLLPVSGSRWSALLEQYTCCKDK